MTEIGAVVRWQRQVGGRMVRVFSTPSHPRVGASHTRGGSYKRWSFRWFMVVSWPNGRAR